MIVPSNWQEADAVIASTGSRDDAWTRRVAAAVTSDTTNVKATGTGWNVTTCMCYPSERNAMVNWWNGSPDYPYGPQPVFDGGPYKYGIKTQVPPSERISHAEEVAREAAAAAMQFGATRSLRGNELANLALQTALERFPGSMLHNDKADAFRHCFWSAMMAKDAALSPADVPLTVGLPQAPVPVSASTFTDFAYEIGYNHEYFNDLAGQPPIEYAMDMSNNNVGLGIGKRLGRNATIAQVSAACDEALNDGRLIWIQDGHLTGPAVYYTHGLVQVDAGPNYVHNTPTYREVRTDLSGQVAHTGPIVATRQ
jgi:hypothetical protein